MSSEFQLRLHCRDSSAESFDKVRHFVSAGVNVHSRCNSGLNALMYAAIGFDRAPNDQAFFYLFNQQEQPLSIEEKIDGLELLGAGYILNKNFHQGLECWLQAIQLRPTAKELVEREVNRENSFVKCEWTIAADIIQLKRAISDSDGEEQLIYQAMLVRLRLLGEDDEEHHHYLSRYVMDYLAQANYSRYMRMSIFFLEWSQLHGECFSRPISYFLQQLVFQLSLMSSPEHPCHHVRKFSTIMKILEWITFVLAKPNEQQMNGSKRFCWQDLFLDCVVQLVVLSSEITRSGEEDFQLKKCLYSLVKLNWRTSDGLDLLLLACCPTSITFRWRETDYFPLPSAKVVDLLIEVGADPNTTDAEGNTGMHILAIANMLTQETALVTLLLNNGAHWDRRNNLGLLPLDLLPIPSHTMGSDYEKENTMMIPIVFQKYISLKCLCAKTVRQHYRDICFNHSNVPRDLIEFLRKH